MSNTSNKLQVCIFDIIEYPSSTIRCARAEYYRISRSIWKPPRSCHSCRRRRTLFGKQTNSSKRVENSMSWIFMKLIWRVHMHLLYHVQCTKTIFIAWFGCRSSESTTKFTRSGWIYLMKLAYCSKSLLTSQIRQNFNSSVS